jgi:hypothetical protein
MTLHYHGTPITGTEVFLTLPGKHFCVSHFRPDQVAQAHHLGQSVMLDNGAFSKWKAERRASAQGRPQVYTDWPAYYAWTDQWLDHPTTWAVIPDEIGGGDQEQDSLIAEWPHGTRGAPVFHLFNMDTEMALYRAQRLLRLCDAWPRVCIGWAEPDLPILGPEYVRAMDLVWNEVSKRHGRRLPWIHKLRGMQLATAGDWPFASLDSTDVAQNHNRPSNTARAMADRWDAAQCPPRWTARQPHPDMFEGAAA